MAGLAYALNGRLAWTNVTIKTSAGDVTMVNEGVVVVKKTVGAATQVTLPPSPGSGGQYPAVLVIDGTGDAATNNITVVASSGNINGAASHVISENYGSVLYFYNGTEWQVMTQALSVSAAELAFINGVTAGTVTASKAAVVDANKDIASFRDVTVRDLKPESITAVDSSLGITGIAAAQGGAVAVVGGTSSTSGNAGGAVTLTGGTPGATGVGGAATIVAGVGGATSGNGGVASVAGGAGTAGNGAGGVASVTGGAGQGTGAGGKGQLVGGASGAGATGNGGATEVTGGAAASTNGNGGSVVLAGGAKTGTGVAGMVIERSVKLVAQGAQTAKTTSATLTAAEVLAGIITVNQGGAATSSLTMPLATDMDTAMPDAAAGDAFDFSLINISTVLAEDADILTNTGWTLVGNMAVQSNAAITNKSAGRFRARKTGAGAWTLYRLS